jgi:hypothetical protein
MAFRSLIPKAGNERPQSEIYQHKPTCALSSTNELSSTMKKIRVSKHLSSTSRRRHFMINPPVAASFVSVSSPLSRCLPSFRSIKVFDEAERQQLLPVCVQPSISFCAVIAVHPSSSSHGILSNHIDAEPLFDILREQPEPSSRRVQDLRVARLML